MLLIFYSGGYCNRLYLIKNVSAIKKTDPNALLIRLYGGKTFGSNPYKIITESEEIIIRYEVSKRSMGPKLFGVFSGGLIEEFIPSQTLANEHLMNPVRTFYNYGDI